MLVYSNYLILNSVNGVKDVINQIPSWIKQYGRVDIKDISRGTTKKLKFGRVLETRSTQDVDDEITYPYYFCARLTHPDDGERGGRWITEIGVKKIDKLSPVECTVLLGSEEASGLVRNSIQVTRPRIVPQIIEHCAPKLDTPGLTIKKLTTESAPVFLSEIELDARKYPIVLVSRLKNGEHVFDIKKLQSYLVGIASIVDVPANEDTFELERKLGGSYCAWGGGVNIIWPKRVGSNKCGSKLFNGETLKGLQDSGVAIENEILAHVTHRTNVPISWKHISIDHVSHAVLRSRLRDALERAREKGEADEYISLLEQAMDDISEKEDQIKRLRDSVEAKDRNIDELESKVQGLKHALEGRYQDGASNDSDFIDTIQELRDKLKPILSENQPPLEHAVDLIQMLFPDRVVVLENAIESSREASSFRYGRKAIELLVKLSSDYWDIMSDGKSEQNAMRVFGNKSYAQNEGDALSVDGRKRRTYTYKGKDFLMEKHLKIGVKDSASETLRIHFEWIDGEKKIIIGHCGKHLDF